MRRAPLGLVLGLALLTSCRSVAPLPGATLRSDDPRPAALVERARSEGAARRSLRARARVSVEGSRGSSFARQLLLIERPARLRLEVIGMLGQRVAVLATDGEAYDLYRAEWGGIERGTVHENLLYEVAGVALSPEQAVRLLLGDPIGGGPAPVERAMVLEDASLVLELEEVRAGVRRWLDFDPSGELTRYAEAGSDGDVTLEVRYADYRFVGEGRLAHELEVRLPGAGARARVTFQQVEMDPELPDALFRLPLGSKGGAGGSGGG